MVKTRFGKTTKGINAQVFVASECAYTTQATYDAFAANLPTLVDGEMGVFLEDGTLRVAALTVGLKFFVAQKVSSQSGEITIKRSITYSYGVDSNITGYVYDAPVKPVVYVGWNGVSGSLNATAIALNLDYGITLTDTTPPATEPLDSIITSKTVSSLTETVSTILGDPKTGLVALLNGNSTGRSYFSPLQGQPSVYIVDLINNGTYIAVATTATGGFITGSKNVIAGGANNVAIGDVIRVGANIGTTNVYTVTATGTTAFAGAGTNDYTIDRPYTGISGTITVFRNTLVGAAITESGLKITSKDYFTTFRANVWGGFVNATITNAVTWKLGQGTPEAVTQVEDEGNIFEGTGHYYNIAFGADYGLPTKYANLSRAYGKIKVRGLKAERSVAAPEVNYSKETFILIKAPYGSATFTIGGISQAGFGAIVNPQIGLATSGTNTPLPTLAAIFPNV